MYFLEKAIFIILIFIASLSALKTNAQNTMIVGVLKDTVSNDDLIGANVILEGTKLGATADLEGKFEIRNVSPGSYILKVVYVGYKEYKTKINIGNGEKVSLNIFMINDANLKEVEVLGTRITNTEAAVLIEMKKANSVVSGISKEQITRTQDRDAADVAKRIPGVTVVENRFVMVRGLSERYNTVMLNNAITPSSEQEIKAFSFDVIPSQMIDRMLIFKSPAPELPGEFSGGLIKVFTTSIPAKNSFSIGISSSYRTNTTFNTFYAPKKGKYTELGFDDGTYALPKRVPSDFSAGSKYDLLKVSKLFRNDTWLPESYQSPLDGRLNLNFTRKIYLSSNIILGIISAVNYSNTRTYLSVDRLFFNPGIFDEASSKRLAPELVFDFKENQYSHSVKSGILQNIGLQFGSNHSVEWKNLYNHQGFNQYFFREGFSRNIAGNDPLKDYTLWNVYKDMFSSQLNGDHKVSNSTEIDWTLGYSKALRDEPDIKRYQQINNNFNVSAGGNYPMFFGRIFTKINEDVKMTSGNIEQKIFLNSRYFQTKLKAGFYLEEKKRQFELKNYGYGSRVAKDNLGGFYNDADLNDLSLDSLNNPGTWNNYNGLVIGGTFNGGASYRALNKLIAYYAGINLTIASKFNIYPGIRIENNIQEVSKRTHVISYLPSINISYNINEKNIIRTAYGKTINRPEFREIANFGYYDFNLFINTIGNQDLKIPKVHNYDLRYEYYPNSGEFISFGVFYKHFIDPIEKIGVPASGAIDFSFTNAQYAKSKGIETEIRKSLGFMFQPSLKPFFNNLSVVTNAAFINSEVYLGNTNFLNASERPLMGQSPYVINAGLNYRSDSLRFEINIMYNVIGKRIFIAGNEDAADIYEMPRNILDLTITKQIGKHLEIKAGIQDILNQRIQFIQDTNMDGKIERSRRGNDAMYVYSGGDTEFIGYKKGSYYTLGINLKF